MDYAWDKGNQFAQWVDEVGIPSFNIGVGMNSAEQISPLVNGQAVNTNPYGSDQNTISAINNARGEYFSQQHTNAIHNQQLINQIMSIPYSTVQRNRNTASLDRRGFLNGIGQSVEDFFTFLDNTTIAIADGDSEYLTGLISSISLGNMLGGGFEISLPNDSYSAGYILAGMIPAYILKSPEQVNISLFKTRFRKGNFRGPKGRLCKAIKKTLCHF